MAGGPRLSPYERAELRCLATLYPPELSTIDQDFHAHESAFSEGDHDLINAVVMRQFTREVRCLRLIKTRSQICSLRTRGLQPVRAPHIFGAPLLTGRVIRFVLLHQFEIHEREDCPSLPRPRSPLVSIEPQKVTRRLLHGSRFVPLSDAILVIKSSLLLPDFLRTPLSPFAQETPQGAAGGLLRFLRLRRDAGWVSTRFCTFQGADREAQSTRRKRDCLCAS